MSEHRRFLRKIATANPATLVGRYRTIDTLPDAHRFQHEVRRCLRAGRHLKAVA